MKDIEEKNKYCYFIQGLVDGIYEYLQSIPEQDQKSASIVGCNFVEDYCRYINSKLFKAIQAQVVNYLAVRLQGKIFAKAFIAQTVQSCDKKEVLKVGPTLNDADIVMMCF